MSMSNRLKMVVGGLCNLIVLVTFSLVLVVLSENRVVQHVLANTVAEANSNRVVLTTTDAGSFVGKKEPLAQDDPNEVQRTFFAFRGLPYAAPPLGKLRWAPPEPVELKSTPQQAAVFKPPCSQWSGKRRKVIGAPDCLYLNVFTPYIPSTSKRRISGNVTSWTVENPNLLPVLVYIHGGEWLSGSATKYSPDALMKRERVVLVTFNYRLGVLGFLSNGNELLPGNYGLMDQITALKWVSKYIHRFGGNPLRVTIFGSVEYLLMANLGEGKHELFHAAIIKPQSTSLLSPFTKPGSRQGAKNFLKQLTKELQCTQSDEEDTHAGNELLLDCLRNTDNEKLIRSQMKIMAFHSFPFGQIHASLGPVVDDKILDDEPEALFASGKFHDVPLMVGLSGNEGFNSFFEFYMKLSQKVVVKEDGAHQEETSKMSKNITEVLNEEEVRNTIKTILLTVMAEIPEISDNEVFERVFHSIWNYYFGSIPSDLWEKQMDQIVQKLLRLFGDMLVNTGHCKLLHFLSTNAKSPVFSYVYNHGFSTFPDYFKNLKETFETSELMTSGLRRQRRSLHMTLDTPWDDQYYLFYPVQDDNNATTVVDTVQLTDMDKSMIDALAKIWVSFAKYAQPKQAMAELPEYNKWVRMEPGFKSLNYFLFSNSSLQRGMRSDFRKAECQFWLSTIPQVRSLSKEIQDLEPFPILFWSSVSVVVLFSLIILTLIVLILCAKRKGSYGRSDAIYLHHARRL